MKKELFIGNLVAKPGVVYDWTEITGNLDANAVKMTKAFPRLVKIGGYLHLASLTSADGLKLPQSIGGYLHLGSLTSAERAKIATEQNDTRARSEAIAISRAMLLSAFAASGYSFADGILARIVSQRGSVSRVIVCGKTEISYLITNGDDFSHGKTLAEARDGLLYKIGSRDTSEFKSWTLDREISKRDAIRAYRIITGACEQGVKTWLEQRETPEKITVRGIIELTRGAYGADKFAGFFVEREAVVK